MKTRLWRGATAVVAALLMTVVGAVTPAGATTVDTLAQTGTIVGRLIDQDGDGVPFAFVDAEGDETWHWASTTTDADGYFTLTGLEPDFYRVAFSPVGGPTQYAYGKGNWGDADLIFVGAGQQVTVNEQLLGTGVLTGRFTDADGNPVYAEVYSHPVDGGNFAWAETDDDGYWSMEVFAGSYVVEFYVDGFSQYAYGAVNWWDAEVFEVAAGGTVTVDDTLIALGTITGRFTDVHGNGLDAWVTAEPEDDEGPWVFGFTDEDGFFSLPVIPGRYRVSFEYHGLTQYAYGTTDWSEAEVFEVAAGETVTVDDTLIAVGAIAGRFTDADGDGLEAEVTAEPVDGDGAFVSTWTDEYGYYWLVVPPGRYRVQFDYDGIVQYAFGATRWEDAEIFEVAVDETVVVDDVLVALGTVSGRFTDTDGTGMEEIRVDVINVHDTDLWFSTFTDEDGFYEIAVVPGDYHVRFSSWDPVFSQYAFGTVDPAEAAVFTVVAGEVTVVNDTRLPTGSVWVTAVDALTGDPLSEFSVELADQIESTENGEVIFEGIPVGTHLITWAWAEGYAFRDPVPVTVTAGERTDVTLVLHPKARIVTTVVDAATGEPVAGVCLFALPQTLVRLPEGCADPSDENGHVAVEVDQAGTYQLLAWPQEAEGYGAQWVGRRGGTGVQTRAVKITVAEGGTATAPVVRMDRAGSITGTVTDPDGNPVTSGWVRIGNEGFGIGGGVGRARIGSDGTYTLDRLGPYEWPLLFEVPGQASQWSGGKSDRRTAEKVTVVADATVTYDHRLEPGVPVAVTVDDPTTIVFVVALNPHTGDQVAAWWLDPTANSWTLPLLAPQRVKLQLFHSGGTESWVGGDDFASAKVFHIRPRGPQTIDLDPEPTKPKPKERPAGR